MLERIDETIVAISSAPGTGPVGIVRASGPKAINLVDRVSRLQNGSPLLHHPGFTHVAGEFVLDSKAAVPARFLVFRAPRSYTRQDLVEIQGIGAPIVLEMMQQRLLVLGARPAEPGEFTARAFLNGALDLASAEAVAGIIRAQSDTQLRAARRMLDGNLAKLICEWRDDLAETLALVEADIDFAEEPIEFITPPDLCKRLCCAAQSLKELMERSEITERLDPLPRILLFGRPNAGKSSLVNRLSGTSRAICAAAAGTTRDILSAPIRLPSGEAVLLDSAGVDDSDDELTTLARAMTLTTAEQIDVLCIVVDSTNPRTDELFEHVYRLPIVPWVIALNKCDLLTPATVETITGQIAKRGIAEICQVSAVTGTGLDQLRAAMGRVLNQQGVSVLAECETITERQYAALGGASLALERATILATAARETIDCADLVAFELREALDSLACVTGEVTTEELLGQVFARFCIGK